MIRVSQRNSIPRHYLQLQLSHPNIVNVFDVGQQEQLYYIVMEYVEGKSLKELLDEEAP